MKRLLVLLAASFILTLALAGWILFIPTGSEVAFALMFPAIWLIGTFFGSFIATSDSGPSNFVALVLASTFLNVVIYATIFLALLKVWNFAKRRRSSARPV